MEVNTLVDEEYLIAQAKADPTKFGVLYKRHFEAIYLFILRRVTEKEVAKDISQQVFLKALQSLGKYTYKGLPFSSYLYRIAINESNLFFRDQSKVRYVTINQSFKDGLRAEIWSGEGNRTDDWFSELGNALRKLKAGDLMLIELRFFENKSFKEIGSILEITENLAKVRVYRVLKKLKKEIQVNYEE